MEADEGEELPELELKLCIVVIVVVFIVVVVVVVSVEADGTDGEKGREVDFGFEVIGAVKHKKHNETIRQ